MPRPYDTSVRITGDDVIASRWLTFAYNLIDQGIVAYGQGDFRTTRMLHESGEFVFVAAGCVSGIYTVHIHAEPPCEIAIEHGLVDMLGIGFNDPLTYQSGRLYGGESVQGYAGTDIGELHYDVIGTLSGQGLQLTPQKPEGEASVAFSVEGGESNYLAQKKQAAYYFPASMLSGKARLWMQALYARKPPKPGGHDVFPYFPSTSGVPSLTYVEQTGDTVRTLTIASNETTTTGIYTTDQYEYFLLNITASTIQIYQMVRGCGDGIRSLLVEYGETLSFDDRCRLEAYLLAACDVSLDSLATVSNPVGAVTPLAYGWKFSWSGKLVSVISWITQFPGSYTMNFQTTLHTLSLLRRIIEGTVAEATHWQVIKTSRAAEHFQVRPAQDPIWAPNWATKEMFLWWLPGIGVTHALDLSNGSGAYYCWYEQNETLKELRFTIDVSSSTGYEDKQPPCSFGDRGITGWGPDFTATRIGYGGGSEAAVSNNAYSARSSSNATCFYNAYRSSGIVETSLLQGFNIHPQCTGLCADDFTNCAEAVKKVQEVWDSYPPDAPPPWYGFDANNWDYCNYTIEDVSGSGSFGGQIASLIPFYDCEAHYAFSRSDTVILTGTRTISRNSVPQRCIEKYWIRIPLEGSDPITYTYPAEPQAQTNFPYYFDRDVVEVDEPVEDWSPGFDFSGVCNVPDATAPNATVPVDMTQINTGQLFAPSLLNPVLTDTYDTRRSVLGDMKGKGIDLMTGYSLSAPLRFAFVGWV